MRPGAMLGSSVWVVSRRWGRLVVWCSVCVACAGYLRCACWCGCVDGGGLASFCPWSWCRRWVAACVRFLPFCSVVVVGVGALGAWWAWLGAGVPLDVYLVGSLC